MPKVKQSETENWAHLLYVKHPHLYLPELERLRPHSESEVNGICHIFEEFDIGKKSKVLDLSCGIGRHAAPLAKRGYKVVGYDPSGFFLEKAKEYTSTELGIGQKNVRYYQGMIGSVDEILLASGENEFDAVISMFNSLGFTNTRDDLNLLRKVRRLVVGGGILITETENRDWRIRNFLPHMTYDHDDCIVHESWKFDLEESTAKSSTRFYKKVRSSKNLLHTLDVAIRLRLYSLHELKELINKSGWAYQTSYGSVATLEPASFEAPNIVTVSKNL